MLDSVFYLEKLMSLYAPHSDVVSFDYDSVFKTLSSVTKKMLQNNNKHTTLSGKSPRMRSEYLNLSLTPTIVSCVILRSMNLFEIPFYQPSIRKYS